MAQRKSKALRDLFILLLFALLVLACSLWLDPFSRIVSWIYHHDNWRLDELFTLFIFLVFALVVYSWRRWKELKHENREREKAEKRANELAVHLESVFTEVQTLRTILFICESCKRIRDGSGNWTEIETYVQVLSDARFFGGLCPDCARVVYGPDTA
jgi:uncharacterized membrane protein YqjE